MQVIQTKFTCYEFTPQELIAAQQLNDLQRAYLQTEYALKAASRLALTFDPTRAHEFVQEEAYLKGQMELLDSLLHPAEATQPEQSNPVAHN